MDGYGLEVHNERPVLLKFTGGYMKIVTGESQDVAQDLTAHEVNDNTDLKFVFHLALFC